MPKHAERSRRHFVRRDGTAMAAIRGSGTEPNDFNSDFAATVMRRRSACAVKDKCECLSILDEGR
jgi:hypothetical protein